MIEPLPESYPPEALQAAERLYQITQRAKLAAAGLPREAQELLLELPITAAGVLEFVDASPTEQEEALALGVALKVREDGIRALAAPAILKYLVRLDTAMRQVSLPADVRVLAKMRFVRIHRAIIPDFRKLKPAVDTRPIAKSANTPSQNFNASDSAVEKAVNSSRK
jgi:hypothetical protein